MSRTKPSVVSISIAAIRHARSLFPTQTAFAFSSCLALEHPSTTLAMEKQGRASLPPYRPAEALPFELAQHCGIYFEEKLCLFCPSLAIYFSKLDQLTLPLRLLCRRYPSAESAIEHLGLWCSRLEPCLCTFIRTSCDCSNPSSPSDDHYTSQDSRRKRSALRSLTASATGQYLCWLYLSEIRCRVLVHPFRFITPWYPEASN